jgi:Domain of unknown function (DUF4439)
MTRVTATSGPVSGPASDSASGPVPESASESASGPRSGPVSAVQALQAALAAEDAAIFGYGVAGAHLSGNSKSAAEQDWTGHNEARDALAAMISGLGATPVAAQALYRLPFEVHDAASASELAAYLEDGVTRAYLGVVAVSGRRLRTFGALAMQAAAERAAFWRGTTEAFPGLETS